MTLNRAAAEDAGAFESDMVEGLGVRDIKLARRRVGDHIEQGRSDVRENVSLRQGVRVDGEDVLVRQPEANRVIPVAAELIFPPLRVVVEFNDQSHLRSPFAFDVRGGPGVSAGTDRAVINGARAVRIEAVAEHRLEYGRRLIPGLEPRHIDRCLVGADRQGPRSVGEEGHDPDRPAAERRSQAGGIENPYVGASDAGRGQLWIARSRNVSDGGVCAMLSAVPIGRASCRGSWRMEASESSCGWRS